MNIERPDLIFALERLDGDGLLIWRTEEGRVAVGVVINGAAHALPISVQNCVEMGVELLAVDLTATTDYAQTIPAALAVNLAAALLEPHRKTILGASAIVERAAKQRDDATAIA